MNTTFHVVHENGGRAQQRSEGANERMNERTRKEQISKRKINDDRRLIKPLIQCAVLFEARIVYVSIFGAIADGDWCLKKNWWPCRLHLLA